MTDAPVPRTAGPAYPTKAQVLRVMRQVIDLGEDAVTQSRDAQGPYLKVTCRDQAEAQRLREALVDRQWKRIGRGGAWVFVPLGEA